MATLSNALGLAFVYRAFGSAIGATRARAEYVATHIRPKPGDHVLDIGCGPADILAALPQVTYVGFDANADYIASARRRFGDRGEFNVATVNASVATHYGGFDIVLATGVLHHLDDSEARDLFRVAKSALKPGGVLVTLDGCFIEGQSFIARQLLLHDRGRYVRRSDDYVRLAREVFAAVGSTVRTNLLRIPYTHIVLRCTTDSSV